MLKKFWMEFKEFAFKGNMIDLAVAVVIGAAFSGVINSLVGDVMMPGIIYLTTTAAAAKNKVAETVAGPETKPAPKVATPDEQAAAAATLASAQKAIDAHYTPMVQAYADMKDLQAKEATLPADMQTNIESAATKLQTIREASGAAPAAPAAAPAAPPAPKPEVVKFDWMLGDTGINLGRFVGSLINFVIIALAVFVTIVKLLGSVMKRMGPKDTGPTEPVTKECPMCLSIIPIKARKCAHCTADLPEPARA